MKFWAKIYQTGPKMKPRLKSTKLVRKWSFEPKSTKIGPKMKIWDKIYQTGPKMKPRLKIYQIGPKIKFWALKSTKLKSTKLVRKWNFEPKSTKLIRK